MSFPHFQASRTSIHAGRALASPPTGRFISYASSSTHSPSHPPRVRPIPAMQTPRTRQRRPEDEWELLMRESSEGARRGGQWETGGEMRPEKRATETERFHEESSLTPFHPDAASCDTAPGMREQRYLKQTRNGSAHPPLRHKKGTVLRGSYRDPLPPPPSSLPRRPPSPLGHDFAPPPPASSFAPPFASRHPIYDNDMQGGSGRRPESFVRGEARGRPSQPAFASSSGARAPNRQYGGQDARYKLSTGGRQGPQPALADPRHAEPAPPRPPPAAASTSRQFAFGTGSSASCSMSFSATGAGSSSSSHRHSNPPLQPTSSSPDSTPTPSLSQSDPLSTPRTRSPSLSQPQSQSLAPTRPRTDSPPSRLLSPSLDPGPSWLTEALYGPSHAELSSSSRVDLRRKRVRVSEREDEDERRGLLGGWDWESWEREKGRKRQRKSGV